MLSNQDENVNNKCWLISLASLIACTSCNRPVEAPVEKPSAPVLADHSGVLSGEASSRDVPDLRIAVAPTEASSLAIFEKRILPIFQSPKPSSCAECHLSGVDLKDYIRPSQEETFAALVAAEMVDLRNPQDSKLLEFIRRRPDRPNLVSQAVRQEELAAFEAWIRAAVTNPLLLKASQQTAPAGPQLSAEVIRHARRDRVLASFVENVWSEVGRCAACHSPDRNGKQVKEHGEQVSWIKLNDPQATLSYMLDSGLIDLDSPENSLLLTKPTKRVEHGGGQKMVVGDFAYKHFRRFIDDYAAVVQGKYSSADQLPTGSAEVSVASEIWLKIADVPTEYDKMLLQADVYRWAENGWSESRVATSDRPVFGAKQLWQHSLSLTARRGTQWEKEIESKKLPAGRYLVKLYVDRTRKLERDFNAQLGESDYVGQIEFEGSWPPGYSGMTSLKFPTE